MTTTLPPRRALLVTPGFTLLDGPAGDRLHNIRATPDDTWRAGFGRLLDRVAKTVDREATLLLDTAAAHALKLPATPAESSTVGLDDARAAGWMAGTPGAWTTFYATGRPTLVVGLPEHPDFKRCPLRDETWWPGTVARCAMWQDLTGSAWRGTPGVAAMTLMRATLPELATRTGGKARPARKLTDGPDGAYELDMNPEEWARPQTARYAHGYDVTRMYLAASGACETLAPWALRHTGRITPNRKLAGWWRVQLGPWNHDQIPPPAGPGPSERWITTPTLALLMDLMEAGGPFQEFEVIDSWTGAGKRLLRTYAETLETTYQRAAAMAGVDPETIADPVERRQAELDAADAPAIMRAVKLAYREGNGMLNHDGNSIFRPDWHYAVIALSRSNLWRRMWAIGQTENRWPLEVQVDHVWYESDDPDPIAAKPAGIPLYNVHGRADTLGTFKPKPGATRGRKTK